MIKIRNCTFAFKCTKKWDELDTHYSNNPNPLPSDIRFCNECNKPVYFVDTDKKLAEAVKADRCVAVQFTKEDLESAINRGLVYDYEKSKNYTNVTLTGFIAKEEDFIIDDEGNVSDRNPF